MLFILRAISPQVSSSSVIPLLPWSASDLTVYVAWVVQLQPFTHRQLGARSSCRTLKRPPLYTPRSIFGIIVLGVLSEGNSSSIESSITVSSRSFEPFSLKGKSSKLSISKVSWEFVPIPLDADGILCLLSFIIEDLSWSVAESILHFGLSSCSNLIKVLLSLLKGRSQSKVPSFPVTWIGLAPLSITSGLGKLTAQVCPCSPTMLLTILLTGWYCGRSWYSFFTASTMSLFSCCKTGHGSRAIFSGTLWKRIFRRPYCCSNFLLYLLSENVFVLHSGAPLENNTPPNMSISRAPMEARRNGVMFADSSWVVTSASLGVWSAKSERNQLLLSRTLTCFFLIN